MAEYLLFFNNIGRTYLLLTDVYLRKKKRRCVAFGLYISDLFPENSDKKLKNDDRQANLSANTLQYKTKQAE